MEVRFPNGVVVRAVGFAEHTVNASWRTFGLYLDQRWEGIGPSTLLRWPDYSLPENWEEAAEEIRRAYERAFAGEHVEVGCAGGLGRTGTVLACMAVLAGVATDSAVEWVRSHYDSRAIETAEQQEWVRWFAEFVADGTTLGETDDDEQE